MIPANFPISAENTYGCGFNVGSSNIFFTKNGTFLGVIKCEAIRTMSQVFSCSNF